jgi:hypothetical protein
LGASIPELKADSIQAADELNLVANEPEVYQQA